MQFVDGVSQKAFKCLAHFGCDENAFSCCVTAVPPDGHVESNRSIPLLRAREPSCASAVTCWRFYVVSFGKDSHYTFQLFRKVFSFTF